MGSNEFEPGQKQHAICVPFPTQSHIGAMLKLAKLLHHRGFHISFVNTEFNHRRLVRTQGLELADGTSSGFRFLAIPDGIPPSDADATQDLEALSDATRKYLVGPLCDLLSSLASDSSVPPATRVVSDGFMALATNPAAAKFGIPLVHMWTISGCALLGLMHLRTLEAKGFTLPKDESSLMDAHLDTPIDWIPGMKRMRLRDLFNFIGLPNGDKLFDFTVEVVDRASEATSTIVNTFEALEPDVLGALSSLLPRVYPIGPLHLLINRARRDETFVSEHIKGNLWEEHSECLKWLDSKKPKTVIYINFGSIAFVTHEQLMEFAIGLANSKQYFLWIFRPDLVNGDAVILPVEFVEETKERGFVSGWCPQEKVLSHPSVGGFLTHCGWNSCIESISAGVPMLCWPRFGDQKTNSKYICDEWEAGLEIGRGVKRDELERLVRELMDGEVGKKMRSKAMDWKKIAEEAVGEHGSSSMNLDKFVKEVSS
ncbi:7-deoxyloganetin glucosyltransferase-like [Rhodamnia argentea]|uniref:Glycosyltransferase n=1 Tax=Rhodamnia argentea TaxID=178133 RepID=A0A8B8P0D6_9MYRT|nr:7-deoxyloganetin glucosyltransferase-like [Rhodamnia argentea]